MRPTLLIDWGEDFVVDQGYMPLANLFRIYIFGAGAYYAERLRIVNAGDARL